MKGGFSNLKRMDPASRFKNVKHRLDAEPKVTALSNILTNSCNGTVDVLGVVKELFRLFTT